MATFKFANLDEWTRQTEARMLAVVKQSIQDVAEVAQTPKAQGGNMPVDTGTLRNSFMSSLNGSTYLTGPESYVMVLGGLNIGNVATFGWGGLASDYALRQNYGFIGQDSLGRNYNQQGNFFLEGALAQFPRIVAQNIERAKAVVAANTGVPQ